MIEKAIEAQRAQEMEELKKRIELVYRGKEGRKQARDYVVGLLSPIERKNGWQLAEGLRRRTPCAIQQFLYRGRWEADARSACPAMFATGRILRGSSRRASRR
jgi:SRSO17 transposase